MYSTVSAKLGDSADGQALLGECARCDRVSQGGIADVERGKITAGRVF
ncbi:hypothetical protein [Anabaena azotica]|uniref:Uncharacterized protein n=1 Tax=Anabaena azotica FACHB-119 TaxID=947527 RepID=A0ABR8DBT7_9NOST|nr:hypothetical protein [Anabaena azotica]MBD2504599.1 hypothetical protein [Anabaena azotica FACHB-119]